jgi:hypothetical protein
MGQLSSHLPRKLFRLELWLGYTELSSAGSTVRRVRFRCPASESGPALAGDGQPNGGRSGLGDLPAGPGGGTPMARVGGEYSTSFHAVGIPDCHLEVENGTEF